MSGFEDVRLAAARRFPTRWHPRPAEYDPKEHPRDLARQYDKVQKREATLTVLPEALEVNL